jgi:hypothetical protein
LVLPSFRAVALPWAAGKYPAHSNGLRSAASAFDVDPAFDPNIPAADVGSYAASEAAASASATVAAVANVAAVFDAAAAVAFAANASAVASVTAATAFVNASADAAFVDSGRSGAELAGLPL